MSSITPSFSKTTLEGYVLSATNPNEENHKHVVLLKHINGTWTESNRTHEQVRNFIKENVPYKQVADTETTKKFLECKESEEIAEPSPIPPYLFKMTVNGVEWNDAKNDCGLVLTLNAPVESVQEKYKMSSSAAAGAAQIRAITEREGMPSKTKEILKKVGLVALVTLAAFVSTTLSIVALLAMPPIHAIVVTFVVVGSASIIAAGYFGFRKICSPS